MKNEQNKASDPILERLKEQWDNTSDLMARARILRQIVKYLKKRYGTATDHSRSLDPMVADLECGLLHLFDYTSNAIADVRRAIKTSGRAYGSGLKRSPTKDEQTDIDTFKSPPRITGAGVTDIEDPNDIGDMGDVSESAEEAEPVKIDKLGNFDFGVDIGGKIQQN